MGKPYIPTIEVVWKPGNGNLPDWLEAEHNAFHELYSGLENHTDTYTEAVYDCLNTMCLIDEVYYYEEVSLMADAAFGNFAMAARHALEAAKKNVEGNRKKDVDSPFARDVKRAVNLSDDLSFLDQSSWPKRAQALRKREAENGVILEAGDRHTANTLKTITKVRKYLNL
jgi:hypothetical protein